MIESIRPISKRYKLELFGWGRISELYHYIENEVYNIPNEHKWSLKGYGSPWILTHGKFEKGMKVLDVGGGYSGLAAAINKKFKTECYVVDDFGVESNEPLWSRWGSRELLKQRSKEVRYVFERLGDIKNSSLEKDCFDIIYSVSALEHIPHQLMPNVFDHMIYLLKPGGCLLHCVDIPIYSTSFSSEFNIDLLKRQILTMEEAANLRSSTSWKNFFIEYFKDKLEIDSKILFPNELASAVDSDIVLETPEVVYLFYPPNRKAKQYRRLGTLCFKIQKEIVKDGS